MPGGARISICALAAATSMSISFSASSPSRSFLRNFWRVAFSSLPASWKPTLRGAGRPDHQDVLRRDLLPQRVRDLLAPPAIAQRDGHRALRPTLSDDVLVELMDNLLRLHLANEAAHSSTSIVRW